MPADRTPLYVRLGEHETRQLEHAVAASGRTKQALVEEAVREHLGDQPLVVGRITLPEPVNDVLTLGEAAALLRVEERALAAAAGTGEVPGRRIGEEWRFSRPALLDWLGR